MSGRFIPFRDLSPNQIFRINDQEWIKCPETMRFEDIIYNAYEHSATLYTKHRLMIEVRHFDDAALVKVANEEPLFSSSLSIEVIQYCDNDN